LQQQQIDHLVVAGMMSDMCIDATVRAAKDLGYQVTVAANACTTKNLAFEGQKIPAQDVHRSFMAALNYYYAEIKNSDELIEQF
jgi:nicotinamidase-related amidase